MKLAKSLSWCALTAATSLLAPQSASATTKTANLAVSAQVSATCSISTTPLDFGVIDPTTGAYIPGTGGLNVTCTNGTPWSVSAGQGLNVQTLPTGWIRAMVGQNTATKLTYHLFTDSARTVFWTSGVGSEITGTGTGLVQNKTVYALINNNQNTSPVDTYSDTVQVTITY